MPELFRIFAGQTIERDALLDALRHLKYIEETLVGAPGEFSLRGGTVDIFPVAYRKPVRVTFSADGIESIYDFSTTGGSPPQSFNEIRLLSVTPVFEEKRLHGLSGFEQRAPLETLKEIEKNDFVVHLNYGVARFLGTKVLKIEGRPIKHLALEFADREILYVEERELPLIDRYLGLEGRAPRLTKLHSKDWAKQKEKTRLAVKSVAHELIELQAKRSLLKGSSAAPDTDWQRQFETEFPYQETEDQAKSTREVKADMEAPKPMDRLLCGDVGYGKTEVAFRAAFKAVMSARQAAFFVPTTILAEQHYLTLKARVRNFPVRVECLSRLRTRAEQRETLAHLADGSCDIVIGTHRLVSRDVRFKNLGLVIIDEEQRFGVRHKEKLKRIREMVDVLTLTATPIPRTLYMALVGARDMSVINTPPKNREPVETEVIHFDEPRIAHIFDYELKRGGQIYFVHNRVQSIEKILGKLQKLVPQVRFGVAHGQMSPRALEDAMLKFVHKETDCLISTNIIESGLDIPNVNTLIVHRADCFGLADLYQLRGRVGRFNRKAYAYFIVPKHVVLTEEAEKRLVAIERFKELGAGFRVAMEDLEIRGAGNLLGHEQSGFIYQVGFDLYCRLLRQAIDGQQKSAKMILKHAHA